CGGGRLQALPPLPTRAAEVSLWHELVPAGGSNQVEQQTLCLEREVLARWLRAAVAVAVAGAAGAAVAVTAAAVTTAEVRGRCFRPGGGAGGSRGAPRGIVAAAGRRGACGFRRARCVRCVRCAAAALALATSPAALAP